MTLRGRAHTFGDNVDTDAILPARYLNIIDGDELARHCFEDVAPDFRSQVRPGDVIVAGENFGCGSAREHAPLAIKASGIGCVVAASFARIFFRNAINLALPVVECPEAAAATRQGDDVEVSLYRGQVTNHTRGCTFRFTPYPDSTKAIIEAGGLIEYTKGTL